LELLKKKQSGKKISKRQERANQPKSSALWMRFVEALTQSVVAVDAGEQNSVQHSVALRRKPAGHLRGRRGPADSRSERTILCSTILGRCCAGTYAAAWLYRSDVREGYPEQRTATI